MLSFKVSDGTYRIERYHGAKDIFYVHFIEYDNIEYSISFIGNLNACVIYCKQRQIEYLENEIERLKSQEDSIVYTEEE